VHSCPCRGMEQAIDRKLVNETIARHLGDSRSGLSRMTMILRSMKKHMGWENAKDGYAVPDGEKTVGRIYRERSEDRWLWSVNTSPFPAPPPNNGLTSSLEEAKQRFKERYEEMKAQGVRPFA
jgi:hypothetical protein